MTELNQLHCATQQDWLDWLDQHHTSAREIWLKLAKKGTGQVSVSRAEAVEVALCYGWIDSQARTLDSDWWLQRFTPRGRKSKWSQINCELATALIEQGRMKPAGLAQVEAAKQDGRWDQAYASPRNITVPPDLQSRLDSSPRARKFFETLDGGNRYAILYRIHDAKKPETRARRIDSFVKMLEEGKTIG